MELCSPTKYAHIYVSAPYHASVSHDKLFLSQHGHNFQYMPNVFCLNVIVLEHGFVLRTGLMDIIINYINCASRHLFCIYTHVIMLKDKYLTILFINQLCGIPFEINVACKNLCIFVYASLFPLVCGINQWANYSHLA
jgi:hypothetical protein